MADRDARQQFLPGPFDEDPARERLEAAAERYPTFPPMPDTRPSLRASHRTGDPTVPYDLAEQVGRDYAAGRHKEAVVGILGLIASTATGLKRGKQGDTARGSKGQSGAPPGDRTKAGDVPERSGLRGRSGELEAQRRPDDQFAPIPGQPRTFRYRGEEIEARPLPGIELAGADWLRTQGRPFETAAAMPAYDIKLAERIAQAYEAMVHNPSDPKVQRAYEKLMEETLGQFEAARRRGYTFEFTPPGQHPYPDNPAGGYIDLARNRRLQVFPTREGFGAGGLDNITPEMIRDNPLLRDSGVRFGNEPATHNDLFRTVHDLYGHHGPGNPRFREAGEARAYLHHALMYGPEARAAAASELRGQNSWVNRGPHGDANRTASAADTVFADQKVGLLPDFAINEGMAPRRNRERDLEALERLYEENPAPGIVIEGMGPRLPRDD